MIYRSNIATLGASLARFLGIKGDLDVPLDATLLPVVNIGDLTDSPYSLYGVPCGVSAQQLAVAAEIGFVGAIPGPGRILQIEKVFIRNLLGVRLDAVFSIVAQSDIVTAGLTFSAKFRSLATQRMIERLSSELWVGTHTTTTGDQFLRISVPATDTREFIFPKPGVILYGNDEGGLPGLFLEGEVVNQDVGRVSFLGHEWPLPG